MATRTARTRTRPRETRGRVFDVVQPRASGGGALPHCREAARHGRPRPAEVGGGAEVMHVAVLIGDPVAVVVRSRAHADDGAGGLPDGRPVEVTFGVAE